MIEDQMIEVVVHLLWKSLEELSQELENFDSIRFLLS
jgi:hypothetical protein